MTPPTGFVAWASRTRRHHEGGLLLREGLVRKKGGQNDYHRTPSVREAEKLNPRLLRNPLEWELTPERPQILGVFGSCLLYTSDAADE